MRYTPLAILALTLLVCPLAVPPSAHGEDPKPEAEEKPLEGEAKKQYEAERKRHLKKLKRFRERADLLAYLEKMAKSWTRAGRDALIRFTAKSKDSEILASSFFHLVASKDPVAIRFVCGPDGMLSRREETQLRAFNAMWRAKSPAIAGPILEVLDQPRMNIDVKTGLLDTISVYAKDDPRVLDAMLRYAADGKHQVRTMALERLGAAQSERATMLLLEVVAKSRSSKDRKAAWIGLRDTKRKDLLPRLQKIAKSERQAAVRDEAAKTLAVLDKIPAKKQDAAK